jgi:serine/threonine protein kinase
VTTERPLGSSYVLEEIIGRGAMGQVWRGRDRDGHRLAFKLLRPELTEDPKVVQRFVQERSILTSIEHPNVVSMRDLVVEGDTLAIVMDLVDGGDLRTLLSSTRTLPAVRVAELGAGIAAGLAAVHAAGVIHRDVKPENVLVDGAFEPGRPRLTDFGIAKFVQQEGSSGRSTMLVGTPQYIAPELVDGQEPTAATDLYALGVMLYELVCGVTPFAGGSTLAVLRNHAERLPGRPAGVPDSLWELISWLLGKHAAARPQSAGQVATLLDALVPELLGVPAAPALTEPPEPEPSVHTQMTTMTPRPSTGSAAGAILARKDAVGPAAPSKKAFAGRRRVVLVGALTGALLVGGGGYAAAKIMSGSGGSGTTTAATPSPASTSASSTDSSGTSTTSAPSTTDAASGTAPELVGLSLSDVSAALPAGTTVNSVDKLDEASVDGIVLAQKPKKGEPLGDTVEVTVARQPVTAYVDELTAISGDLQAGPMDVTGKTLPHAMSAGICAYSNPSSNSYDLGKHYERLVATLGQADNSTLTTAVGLVEIFADGRKVFAQNVTFGKTVALDVDVTDVLRLEVKWRGTNCADTGGSESATLVFGDLRLLGVPGEVPSPSATS